jgi:single-strand DNA-binding protein
MNRVFLVGRLTADPVIKTAENQDIAEFGIAVNSNGNYRADFFDVVTFGGWAKNLSAHKGDAVVIEGRLRQERWQDKESGENRSRVRVIASSVKELKKFEKEAPLAVPVGNPY